MFGPVAEALPNPAHALATFLRDTLGIAASTTIDLSNKTDVPESYLPFYDRQRNDGDPADIVIFDLSLLAAEVLGNVTALIGRLILEFLQRLGEHGGEKARGSLPVVLVLEEAQNYIQQQHFAEEESIARVVFERIAREGRKYGLSLVIASPATEVSSQRRYYHNVTVSSFTGYRTPKIYVISRKSYLASTDRCLNRFQHLLHRPHW